ncbi:hypothetical protein AAHF58_000150 [Escherichia coli]|uniref:Uncharacterized protein n=1 Tax=Escherichia phage RB49 TaxID=50948 RepID=Q7Y3L2_BPRB4|nr:hypothetical protein RB49p194 [Escherichia phage RB49]AAQ15423.1 hypothetical protein RB49ORF194c [Escherichia phage RB49]
MALTKTTTNFAKRHGFDLEITSFNDYTLLCVYEIENDCEWMFSYRVNEDGSFTWNGNIYLAQEVKEELPATIKDEKHLRQVLKFISENI